MKKFRIDLKEGKGNKDFIRGKVTAIMDLIIGIRETEDGRKIYQYVWHHDTEDIEQKYMRVSATNEQFEVIKECLVKARLYPNIIDITEI